MRKTSGLGINDLVREEYVRDARIKIAPDILREVMLYVCANATDVDDARRLLDMLGVVQQEPGYYAMSDEELIATGNVCGNGHPQNRKNSLRTQSGQRARCLACHS